MMLCGSSARLIDLHQVDGITVLGDERAELVHADPVLAGARPAHRDRAERHPLGQALRLRPLRRIVRIEQHDQVEVAVADVADDRRDEPRRVDVGLGLEDAVREARDRHARVGREPLRAGHECHRRVIRRMPRLPQPRACLGLARPLESAAAVLLGDRLHLRGLLRDARVAAVELEEERRLLGEARRASNSGCRRASGRRRGARSARPGSRAASP